MKPKRGVRWEKKTAQEMDIRRHRRKPGGGSEQGRKYAFGWVRRGFLKERRIEKSDTKASWAQVMQGGGASSRDGLPQGKKGYRRKG